MISKMKTWSQFLNQNGARGKEKQIKRHRRGNRGGAGGHGSFMGQRESRRQYGGQHHEARLGDQT